MVLPINIEIAKRRRLGTDTQFRQQLAQNLRQQRLQTAQNENVLRSEAQRLEKLFREANYGGSVEAFKTEYQQIPIEIRKFMRVTPQVVSSIQSQTIISLQNALKQANKDADKYADKMNSAKDSNSKLQAKSNMYAEQVRASAIKDLISNASQGKIYDINNAQSYLDQVAKAEYYRRVGKYSQEMSNIKAALTGDVSKIDYTKNLVTVNGQRIPVPKTIIKSLELSSTKRTQLNKLITKAVENKPLSVSDFETARKLGIKREELLKIAVEGHKLRPMPVAPATQKPRQPVKSFIDKELGGLSKVFTPEQKKVIEASYYMTSVAENEMRKKFKEIDNRKDLLEFQKEELKREYLGIYTQPSNYAEVLKEYVKASNEERGNIGKVIQTFIPVINPSSQQTYNNILNNTKLNFTDYGNLAFDTVAVVGLMSAILTKGKTLKYIAPTIKVGQTLSKFVAGLRNIKNVQNVGKVKNLFKAITPKQLSSYLYFTSSIIADAGWADRAYKSMQTYYKVDNKLLDETAKRLKLKDNTELYAEYISIIDSNLGVLGKKNAPDKFAEFIGLDARSNKFVIRGQIEYLNYLINNGFDKDEARKIISNLESKRISRVWGQSIGALKSEVSSERLAAKIIAKGGRKAVGVGVAGGREAISVMAQEYYVQGSKLTPEDFMAGVILGAAGSIFFSKQMKRGLKESDVIRIRNKLANDMGNSLKPKQQLKFTKKLINKYLDRQQISVSPMEKKRLIDSVSTKEAKALNNTFIKVALRQIRLTQTRSVIQKVKKYLYDRPLGKLDEILRGFVGNVIDPFELPGEILDDIFKKIGIKINKKISKIKRAKIISLSKLKLKQLSKSQLKALAESKTKALSKAESKAESKTESKTKVESKTKSKTKTKTKTKSKTKTKTKVATKTKVPSKTKIKVKTVSLAFPSFGLQTTTQQRKAYKISVYRNNKLAYVSKKYLPYNRASNYARELILQGHRGNGYKITEIGKTKIKDVENLRYSDKFRTKNGIITKIAPKITKRVISKPSRIKKSPKKGFKRVLTKKHHKKHK